MEQLKEYLIKENKKSLLDIGTGQGNYIGLINHLYDGFKSIIGIDVMERLIQFAKEHNKDERVTFELMDAYNMTFEDESFDVVAFSNSLHHIKDVDGLLKSISRVVKKDGFVIISEMINNDLDEMQKAHLLTHHFAAKIDRLNGDIHDDTFSDKEIINKLENSPYFTVEDSWKMEVERRTENSQEELDYLQNIIDRLLSRAPEEHKEELVEEGKAIKEYIKKYGYDGCTTFVCILRKTI
jgi:ubiquinone/menaquinone biosynthesis C-methylase UbiE